MGDTAIGSSSHTTALSSCDEFDHEDLGWYMALCLGGLQSTVKAEVERQITAHGRWRADVQIFQEDFEGADTLIEGVHPGNAGCGKLIVATDAPPDILRNITCIQALFALVAHAASLDIVLPSSSAPDSSRPDVTTTKSPLAGNPAETPSTETQEDDPAALAIARIESEITGSPRWPAALDVWRRFMKFEDDDDNRQSTNVGQASGVPGTGNNDADAGHGEKHSPGGGNNKERVTVKWNMETLKFRASVVRDGRHAFNSMEASPRLGGAVLIVNPHWIVDLKEYDVEVVTFIVERGVAVGLSLSGDRAKRCSHGRIPKEDKGFIEAGKRMASLRPSTAYVMLTLAKPSVGEVVVDCMCGVGTLPFLGARWFPDVFWIGGEVEVDAMEYVKGNLRSLRRSLAAPKAGGRSAIQTAVGAAACGWDAQALPLRDGTVDVMVVDMPFGYSCGTPRANEKLYPTALAEMARVVRRGSGRAVLLVTQPYLLGLPEIQRTRRKERGLHRKRCREAGLPFTGKGGSGGIAVEQRLVHDTSCGNDETLESAHGTESSSELRKHHVREAVELAPLGASVWRVMGRYCVNVGGLMTWLVVLGRTNEPPPPPLLDRRKRWVGLGTSLKRTKEHKSVNQT